MKTNRALLQLIILLVLVFVFTTISANEPETKSILIESNSNLYQSSDSDVRLKLVNIQFDPLGFIFFGPQIGMDFQFANMIAVGPYVRWNYAGLLYQGEITEWFSNETTASVASYGVGIGAKIIPPIGSGRHRPYFDIGIEKFKGKESYDPGGTYGRHYYEYKADIFHFGAGYRMLTESSFNMSIGFFIGIHKETENFDYYEFESTKDYNTLEDPRVFPGVQLMLGWQIGGN